MEGPTEDINLKDFGLPLWGEKHIRLDANQADCQHAIKYPLMGGPNFARTFGGNRGTHLTHEVFNTDSYCDLDPRTRDTRAAGRDPVSMAPRGSWRPACGST